MGQYILGLSIETSLEYIGFTKHSSTLMHGSMHAEAQGKIHFHYTCTYCFNWLHKRIDSFYIKVKVRLHCM